jgi:phenylacetate-CoA ligase
MHDHIERMVIKLRDVLAETERLSPDKLRVYQENLLAPLVQHARRNAPFYERRLAPLFGGADVDLSRWDEVPILTRAEAQRNTQALTARIVPPHAGAIEEGETSGSTGRPLRYLVNELTNVASLGATDRTLRWWDFDGAKTMASFVARKGDDARPPEGATVVGWRVGSTGLHHMIDMSADTDTRIDWLLARRPHYLTTHSFTLLGLAERVRARGVNLRFERINSTSTVLSDEIRNVCQEVLGARPIDQYGARETGLIACECPWCGHYHINAESMLVEILDPQGQPSLPGETGRVVLTSLYNYAMPFIRYEIGDYAIAGPKRVKCPVKLPALAQIMGRYRNSFTLRDGRVVYPFVPIARLHEFISFAQFQIVQTDYGAIEVRYVPLDRSRAADAAGLEACVRELIDASFNVRAVAVDEIPRSASGKFEDYLSLVPQQRS